MEQKTKKRLLYVKKEKRKKEISSVSEAKQRLKNFFKLHIGLENSATPYEIFSYVFNKEPYEVDFYERTCLWGILKRIMATMRTTNECFIVHRGSYAFFVLQSGEELNGFRKTTDKHISTLIKHEKNAEEWVRKGMWKNFDKEED